MSRKFRNLSFAAVLVLLVAAGIFLGGGAVAARRVTVKIPASATLVPATVNRPGDAARAEVVFMLPWGNSVAAAELEAEKGVAVSGAPEISSRLRWGYRIWRVGATLRPLGTKGAAPGKFLVTLDKPPHGAESARFEVTIPEVRVTESAAVNVNAPRLAGPETRERRTAKWWIIPAAAVVILAAAGYLLRRRRRLRPAPTPWELALSALETLETEMKKRNFRAETGVWKLSDILRGYLARRFGIDSVTAADSAFLAADAVKNLEREDREFLHGFFAAALLVEFARVPADMGELENSVAAAHKFVEHTVPPPEPDKKTEAAS